MATPHEILRRNGIAPNHTGDGFFLSVGPDDRKITGVVLCTRGMERLFSVLVPLTEGLDDYKLEIRLVREGRE